MAAASSWSSSAAAADAATSTAALAAASAEGQPAWLEASPVAHSPEGLGLEAATVVLRQGLDIQAVQVGRAG